MGEFSPTWGNRALVRFVVRGMPRFDPPNGLAQAVANSVRDFLDKPAPAALEIARLRTGLEQATALSSAARSSVLSALSASEHGLARLRQREAAEIVAAALRPLGVRLQPLAPSRKKRRKSAQVKAPAAVTPTTSSLDADGVQRVNP